MDKLPHYRKIIKTLLQNHADIINRRPNPQREVEVCFDEKRDHYIL